MQVREKEDVGAREVAEGGAELDGEVGDFLGAGFEDYYDAGGA